MLKLRFTRLARTGGRKSRREGLVRAKKSGLLFVCLSAKRPAERPSPHSGEIAFAVITSKKSVSKLAVVRNKARRRTRAALLAMQKDEHLNQCLGSEFIQLEVLIVHQRDLSDLPFESFQLMLRDGLLRLAENLQKTLREQND